LSLRLIELKPFVPARDFALSRRFYGELGFTERSEGGGIAYFLHDEASFLLQDFYNKELAENLMLHLLVADVDAWHARVASAGLAQRYGVKVSEIAQHSPGACATSRFGIRRECCGASLRMSNIPPGVSGTLHE